MTHGSTTNWRGCTCEVCVHALKDRWNSYQKSRTEKQMPRLMRPGRKEQ
jgi:hypothetical protein